MAVWQAAVGLVTRPKTRRSDGASERRAKHVQVATPQEQPPVKALTLLAEAVWNFEKDNTFWTFHFFCEFFEFGVAFLFVCFNISLKLFSFLFAECPDNPTRSGAKVLVAFHRRKARKVKEGCHSFCCVLMLLLSTWLCVKLREFCNLLVGTWWQLTWCDDMIWYFRRYGYLQITWSFCLGPAGSWLEACGSSLEIDWLKWCRWGRRLVDGAVPGFDLLPKPTCFQGTWWNLSEIVKEDLEDLEEEWRAFLKRLFWDSSRWGLENGPWVPCSCGPSWRPAGSPAFCFTTWFSGPSVKYQWISCERRLLALLYSMYHCLGWLGKTMTTR